MAAVKRSCSARPSGDRGADGVCARSAGPGVSMPPCPPAPVAIPSGRSPAGAARRVAGAAHGPSAGGGPRARSRARSDPSAAAAPVDRFVAVVQFVAIARRECQVAQGEGVDAALGELGDSLEVAGGLGHLPSRMSRCSPWTQTRRAARPPAAPIARSRPRGAGRRYRCRRCGCRTARRGT